MFFGIFPGKTENQILFLLAQTIKSHSAQACGVTGTSQHYELQLTMKKLVSVRWLDVTCVTSSHTLSEYHIPSAGLEKHFWSWLMWHEDHEWNLSCISQRLASVCLFSADHCLYKYKCKHNSIKLNQCSSHILLLFALLFPTKDCFLSSSWCQVVYKADNHSSLWLVLDASEAHIRIWNKCNPGLHFVTHMVSNKLWRHNRARYFVPISCPLFFPLS